jgi:hypothetical protein
MIVGEVTRQSISLSNDVGKIPSFSYCPIKERIVVDGKLTLSNPWSHTCSKRGETPEDDVSNRDICSVLLSALDESPVGRPPL